MWVLVSVSLFFYFFGCVFSFFSLVLMKRLQIVLGSVSVLAALLCSID